MDIKYNECQEKAIEKALKWYYLYSHKKKYFILAGLAGTGKSTTIDGIVKRLNIPEYHRIVYATFTAKASLVLRINGLDSNTIHRTFYSTFKDKKTGKVFFSKKSSIDERIKLIIIDEVSMASDRLIEDILSFGIPTILVGDPSQLPPVAAKNTYIFDYEKVDALLDKIMRQQENSGILQLATKARLGYNIPYGYYNESKVTKFKFVQNKILDYDIVLVWKNDTRRKINRYIRSLLGMKSIYPINGDKLLCLDNNYNYDLTYKGIGLYLINGLIGICKDDSEIDIYNGRKCLSLDFLPDFLNDEYKNYFHVKCYKELFEMYETEYDEEELRKIMKKEDDENYEDDLMSLIDFGYCLTVAKSQGSAFDNVLVIDEYRGGFEYRKKWLYTAITRARKSVTIATI